jgi:hypothetical protein
MIVIEVNKEVALERHSRAAAFLATSTENVFGLFSGRKYGCLLMGGAYDLD